MIILGCIVARVQHDNMSHFSHRASRRVEGSQKSWAAAANTRFCVQASFDSLQRRGLQWVTNPAVERVPSVFLRLVDLL